MIEISKAEDRPMTGIQTPDEHDVPMGRGGYVNSHPGHRRYLKMVQEKQLEYVQCKKSDKMAVAWSIVHELRALDPPARFLKKDVNGLWNDVGDSKFREKVSQALREHQPFIKAVIETNDADSLPAHDPKPAETSPSVGLFTSLKEQPSCSFEETSTPPTIKSADKRRAFLATREEANVCFIENLPEEEEGGFNLSEFSVSQGPSFPDLGSAQSRRASSGWGSLLDILDERHQSVDWDLLTGTNVNVILPEEKRIEDEMLRMDEPLFPGMNGGDRKHDSESLNLKRSSPNCFYGVYEEHELEYSPVKRCTLSRDKSEVARKLKKAYCTIDPIGIEIPDEEGIESLRSALERSFPFPDHF